MIRIFRLWMNARADALRSSLLVVAPVKIRASQTYVVKVSSAGKGYACYGSKWTLAASGPFSTAGLESGIDGELSGH